MSNRDSNITVHIWAPDIRAKVEQAKQTLEHYAVEYSAAYVAWETRIFRVRKWQANRRKLNFDYLWAKCEGYARNTLKEEAEYSMREWMIASEAAASAYANQKRSWFRFRTPLDTYKELFGVEERGAVYDSKLANMEDPMVLKRKTLEEFFNRVKNAFIYANELREHLGTSRELDWRIIRNQSKYRVHRMYMPDLDNRRKCNMPPTRHDHMRYARDVYKLYKAVTQAGSHMINVPASILAAVNTINGEEA
ncbi:hypothetical protein [Stenotrophomonas phage vB_SmaS_BUCT548]|uniref:Uncharacterized protein n=1 Tax=Stenotrophomonas phage vB_SmaS_BUCT548 TaxID=2712941 RepID=A0A7D2LFN8_9CAUD|nr:hypothetical protein PQD75_gp070 [Stenotrophomonas phage vB_SmaS_BUCT548]QIQ60802.1 hypothetical protein [Stenotrophomonas phage vB_SmaS_BUCT548]